MEAGHEVALVVTQPDRRRGRGGDLVPSPVKIRAGELGLEVRAPARAGELVDEVRALYADVGVVVAFGQLLPVPLLEATRFGFVNVHFSLLPRWRGAAPVERAILAGDHETGVCVMRLEAGLDTGPVYARAVTPIGPDETAGDLRARLGALGTDLLVQTLPNVAECTPEPQAGAPTHAGKLSVDEFRIDPRASASDLALIVRAGSPRPGAWGIVAGRRVKVLRGHVRTGPAAEAAPGAALLGGVGSDGGLATGEGVLVLDEVHPEGGAPMPASAWIAGFRGEHPVFECP